MDIQAFESKKAWRDWLASHHADSDGLWLKLAKRGSGVPTVSNDEAVDVAICFGWIDGQRNAFDDTYFLQKFTPRRPRSRWSKINVERVARLEASGEMQPPGRAEVERAKADGRWDAAYAGQRTATVPDDLRAALDASPGAAAAFEALKSSERYSILYRVQDAKKPETRARRIAEFVATLAGQP